MDELAEQAYPTDLSKATDPSLKIQSAPRIGPESGASDPGRSRARDVLLTLRKPELTWPDLGAASAARLVCRLNG